MMNIRIPYFLIFALAFFIGSCQLIGPSPETIFNKIGLNANKIPKSSFHRHFKEILAQKAHYGLKISSKEVSVAEYVEFYYKSTFEKDIQEIEKLQSNEETKPIIEAALDMFQYADEIYKADFPKIAKMIDDGKTEEEVNAAIDELDATKGTELDKKYEKTMGLVIPYADKHGVEYKTIHMP